MTPDSRFAGFTEDHDFEKRVGPGGETTFHVKRDKATEVIDHAPARTAEVSEEMIDILRAVATHKQSVTIDQMSRTRARTVLRKLGYLFHSK